MHVLVKGICGLVGCVHKLLLPSRFDYALRATPTATPQKMAAARYLHQLLHQLRHHCHCDGELWPGLHTVQSAI